MYANTGQNLWYFVYDHDAKPGTHYRIWNRLMNFGTESGTLWTSLHVHEFLFVTVKELMQLMHIWRSILITDIVPGFFLVHAVDRHAGTYTVHSSSRILTTHAMHQSSSYDNDQLASSHVTNVTQLRNSETYWPRFATHYRGRKCAGD